VRAAVATCEGAACVPVIGTKVVFTNLAGVIEAFCHVQVRAAAI